jgi:plasmid maintenance system antidote protein VapI
MPHPALQHMERLNIRSKRELARRIGVKHPTIINWLNGKTSLGKRAGSEISKLFGVSLETVLFQWAPKPRRRRAA